MFKIISAEFKKILSKPGIYILSLLLAVILVLGVFIYNPQVQESNKITFTQAKNNFLENVSSTSKAYFYFNQEFKKGSEISIVVDWGDGNDITYKFKFDIDITEKNN